MSIVANRVRYSVPSLSRLDNEGCWAKVFAETLQYRGNKSFNYVIDRTLYRPREIIEFGTRAIEAAQDQGGAGFPIDYSIISEVELGYSEARIQDIAAEYRFQYPGLGSVFEVFRGRKYLLDREALEELVFQLVTGDLATDESTDQWLSGAEPDSVIETLWRVGFMRARAVGGVKARRRSGSSYLGSYQVGTLNLQGVAQFQVHPMFRAHLGMKEKVGFRPSPRN